MNHLKTLFPDASLSNLTDAATNATSTDEAVEKFLDSTQSVSAPESSSKEGTCSWKCRKFQSFYELLEDYQKSVETDSFVLQVNRCELWRTALGFYKKALNNPKLLMKSFEIRRFFIAVCLIYLLREQIICRSNICKNFFAEPFFLRILP